MRAELKPQASERKSSGKGDKGHLVTKGIHLMSEKAKRKNCSRYVIQVKTYNHYAEKTWRLRWQTKLYRIHVPVSFPGHLMTQFMAGTSGVAA